MSDSMDMRVGGLEVRTREHAVVAHGHEVPLTSREYDIVARLAEHPGWAFSAEDLAGEPEAGEYSPESVSVLVSRLRQKLAAAGVSDLVETVRGVGYRLHPQAIPAEEAPLDAVVNRELRDAMWRLQEAVVEVAHAGTAEQRRTAIKLLEEARHAVCASLAEQ